MRRTLAAAALTLAITGLSAGAAFAADDDSPPVTPTSPTLAGSTAGSACVGDVPYISYSVTLTDPDNVSTDHSVYLRLTDGSNEFQTKLGDLKNNKLSGTILWPGAKVDGNGDAAGWPGWAKVDGQWVETNGNYAWTRGNITASLIVNPELVVPVSYPTATSGCANPTAVSPESPGTSALATTGGTVSLVAAGIGVGALAVGLGLTMRRRRAQR